METTLPKHRIVLLGVGHTNAHILRMWRMKAIPDTELVCVSNYPVATYSGMLPGVLAGQYPQHRMEIDLVRLCSANGARLIVDKVTGLDAENQRLLFDERPPLRFDALSIGVGSVPTVKGVTFSPSRESNPVVLAIKPMQTFLTRLHERVHQLARTIKGRPLRMAVVGGGAGGVEIAFCLPKRIAMLVPDRGYALHLIHGGQRLLPGLLESTADAVTQTLRQNQTQLHLGTRVAVVHERGVTMTDGTEMEFDLVLWATSAVAPPLLDSIDFPKDDRGFLMTKPTLQTLGHDRVFAVGDTGTIEGVDRPKSGVFAVRQGPVLWRNLHDILRGYPLESFQPQTNFLKLLNTADGHAVAEYAGRTFKNSIAWKWKDVIDTKFMDKYQDYRPMEMSTKSSLLGSKSDPPQMRCTGCGGKVSGSVLSRVLKQLDVPTRDEVKVGLESPDDAAVLHFDSQRTISATTDFFAAPLDDPYLTGRLAALNALSDTWAMGGEPLAALTIATIPVGDESAQEDLLAEMLAGSLHEFRKANTALVGGHTIEGPRISLGYTVLADQGDEAAWAKGGLQDGDTLILTKPLGSGVLLAGLMQSKCQGDWYMSLLETITASNQQAAQIARDFDVSAATDVTGFGLATHLLEMLRPSKKNARLDYSELPVLPGAIELGQAGIASTLLPANKSVEAELDVAAGLSTSAKYDLLFDPQTSGGMLLAVPHALADECLQRLWEAYPHAAIIGSVQAGSDSPHRIRVE